MVFPALLRSVASKIARVTPPLPAQEIPHVRRPALPHVSRIPSRLFSSSPTPPPTNQKDLVADIIKGLDCASTTMLYAGMFGALIFTYSWAIPKVKELRGIVSAINREGCRDLVPVSSNVHRSETRASSSREGT